MASSLRSLLRLSSVALVILPALTTASYAQVSMMLRNNSSPAAGMAINRGDFNNDGILDLVTTNNSSTASVSIFLGRADGTFAPPINTGTGQPGSDLAVGDFNHDGKLDVAIVNAGNNNVQVLLGKGDGTFEPPITIPTQAQVASITVSDFDNDGKLDLAVGENFPANGIEMFEGDGTGHFSSVNFANISNPDPNDPDLGATGVLKVRVGDFNRDGKTDIAVMAGQVIWALFGHGDFNFDTIVLNITLANVDMNTGDVNQDGFTDIMLSGIDGPGTITGGVTVYFGQPSESFNSQTLVPSGGNDTNISAYNAPGGLFTADVNGDGINDIVGLDNTSTASNQRAQNGVYVWLCNPDRTCNSTPIKFVYENQNDMQALVAGDFNRDGKIDFAATRITDNSVEVLVNATPRAACQKITANESMTVCQPQDTAFSNSPLHIIAEGNDSKGVSDIDVFVDNVKKGSFASSSINQLFGLADGDHFVVVKGFDSTGVSFRSDRHVTVFSGAPGETCPSSSSTVLSVSVCLPAQNATLSSPVQIFANSYSPQPITAIQVYIDNKLQFNDPTATEVNKLFSLAPGIHDVVVKAWDLTGHNISESRTIDVK